LKALVEQVQNPKRDDLKPTRSIFVSENVQKEATGENAGMQSKAAKSVIPQGRRARLAGLLLCAMQFHFKFEANKTFRTFSLIKI